MVELLGGFPVREVVALQAVVPQLSFVRIFVTGHAFLREPEERFGKILHFNEGTFRANHVHRRVTLLAWNIRVLAFQRIPGLLVIKLLLRWLPMNEREIRAIVLQMAAHTLFPVRVLHAEPGMVAALGVQAPRNLRVAVEALKRRRSGAELMATRAESRSCEGLMRFGKRSGRDLAFCAKGHEQYEGEGHDGIKRRAFQMLAPRQGHTPMALVSANALPINRFTLRESPNDSTRYKNSTRRHFVYRAHLRTSFMWSSGCRLATPQ